MFTVCQGLCTGRRRPLNSWNDAITFGGLIDVQTNRSITDTPSFENSFTTLWDRFGGADGNLNFVINRSDDVFPFIEADDT